jgi:hypothetical protein
MSAADHPCDIGMTPIAKFSSKMPRTNSRRCKPRFVLKVREWRMSERKFLTAEEVSERYRGEVTTGTLRNWRAMKIGPAFVKIGKAVLYPLDELEAWDQKNLVTCRASRRLTGEASDRV